MPAVFRYRMLIIAIFLVALVFVGGVSAVVVTPTSTSTPTPTPVPDVSNAQGLSDALNISITGAAYANGNTVYLLQNVPLNYTINITAASPITLTTAGNDHTIFRSVSRVPLFNVSSGTLILQGNGGKNLTIDGNKATYDGANGNSLIYVNGGIFTMDARSVLQNSATLFIGGGGVNVTNGGTFNMNGGDISNNNVVSSRGDGVNVYSSTFTMTLGNIYNNIAAYSGGGVQVNDGTFNFDGGTISANTAVSGGGGVDVNGGTFNMRGAATVDPDNDVYLDVGNIFTPIKSCINVTGVLSPGAGTLNITPWYTNGTVFSYNSGVSLGTWTSNFALNQTWASGNTTLTLGQSSNDILLGKNCTVNFSINDTTLYLSQYNVSGALLAQPAYPTRSGYTFSGWNHTTSGVNTPWNFSKDRVMVNPTNLSANWTTNPIPTPPHSGNGGNDDNNAEAGSVSPDGTFTTNDGGLTISYPAGSSIIVTVFPDYFGETTAPSGISYLYEYDVYSTAGSGTSVTLVFRVNESVLKEKGVAPENISILHYFDGKWYNMTILSIGHVDGEYLYTVTSTHTSLFMVVYNINASLFPVEGASTPTSIPTNGPTIEPISTTTPTPTQTPSSPVPIIGIIAGLGAVALLMRRE